MSRKVKTTVYDFLGGMAIPAATSAGGSPWVYKKTAAAGTPTLAPSRGEFVLGLDATAEIQNLCLYFEDDLVFDVDDLVRASFWLRLSVALGTTAATTKATWGLASARNDDPDAITASLFFNAKASASVNVECDDGTNEVAATATGQTLATTLKKFVLDFASGSHYQSPPSTSVGGKYAVQAFMEDSGGFLRRVAPATRLNVGSYSAGLQPFFQIQKAANTDLGSLAIARIEIEHYVAG